MSTKNEGNKPQGRNNESEVTINIFGFITFEAKKIRPWVVLGLAVIVLGCLSLFGGWIIYEYGDVILKQTN